MASQWPAPPSPGAGDLPDPPPAQRPPRSSSSDNRFLVMLLAIAALLVVLGVGGCVALRALVDGTVEQTSKELNEDLRKSQNRNSITGGQAKAIDAGTARDEVVQRFGPPAFGPAREPAALPANVRDCISWHIRDGRYGSTWEFCFRDGKLVSKESDLSPSPRRRTPPPAAKPSQEQ